VTHVYWTPEARAKLRGIRDYIAQDNPNAANAIVTRLLRRTRQLQIAPRSGRQVPEYRDAKIRQLLERPYRIIYRVIGDEVAILTVMHYRQLLPHDLPEQRD
jgi:addiction module RelE/StbE family toxin